MIGVMTADNSALPWQENNHIENYILTEQSYFKL